MNSNSEVCRRRQDRELRRRLPTRYLFLFLGALLMAPAAAAPDLLRMCELARLHDPAYKQFQARLEVARENRPQAVAALLPQVALSAHGEVTHQEIKSGLNFGSSRSGQEQDYNGYGYSLSLRQPIYRHELYLRVRRAGYTLGEAEKMLEDAGQKLIVRVAERYFNILAAEDDLSFARKEHQALLRQLEQAEQRFKLGLSAITDVRETRAAQDRALAAELQARNQLDRAREALREITGALVSQIGGLIQELPLEPPQPADIEYWAALSRQRSPLLLALRQAVEVAQVDADIARAGHLPSLDLLSRRSLTSSGGLFGTTRNKEVLLGVEFNLPLFQGGGVVSAVRQARQNHRIAMEELNRQRHAVELLTREAYLAIDSGIGVVRALRRSVLSAQTALEATRAGFEVGTRTSVDIISAERNLSQAQRSHARARYDYLLNHLRLRQAAGLLWLDELRRVNHWLSDEVEPSTPAG